MEVNEASVTGTLRIIAVLLLIWAVLRLLRNRFSAAAQRKSPNWARPDQRPKGEVRIEQAPPDVRPKGRSTDPDHAADDHVSDADFEELK